MDVTAYMRRLEAAGFQEEILDRAVVLAGANRLLYLELYRAVTERGMLPEQALETVFPSLN